jgi:hypothetical protein
VSTGRFLRTSLRRSLYLVPLAILLVQRAAVAGPQVVVTPAFSASPAKDFGGWTFKMALGSISLSIVIGAMLIAAYLRYAPRFYGSDESAGPPSVRPLARAAVAGGGAAVATNVPPLPAPAPLADAPAAVAEAVPSAQASEDAAAVSTAAPPAAAPAPAPAAAPARAPAAAAAPRQEGPVELDQETLDRVLQEELAKGTDRRVAEGRARAAAVRAARRKAEG